MAFNPEYVTAAKPKVGGAVFRAPVGTALPTNSSVALNEAFQSVGFITEDGVTNTRSISSEQVKDWGGDVMIVLQTERGDDWKFTMAESLNTEAMKTFYGEDNVTGNLDDGITIKGNNLDLGTYSYVIDSILRDGHLQRVVIAKGMISATEDVVYKRNEVVRYGVTITGLPDDDGNSSTIFISKKAISGTTTEETGE